MKFQNTAVFGFEHAIRGMRNPLESWGRSDSKWKGYCSESKEWVDEGCSYDACLSCCEKIKEFFIGQNDLGLMQKLIKAGSEHRKFMRQIIVSVDITAPLYWWKEFDTYKVGTVANSTSTMHKLARRPITIDCFEMGDFQNVDTWGSANCHGTWDLVIFSCEGLRQKYNETKDERYWKELIRLLPSSWLQTRTITMNYENILTMVNQRKNHKLTEWSVDFMNWVRTLPYAKELFFMEEKE